MARVESSVWAWLGDKVGSWESVKSTNGNCLSGHRNTTTKEAWRMETRVSYRIFFLQGETAFSNAMKLYITPFFSNVVVSYKILNTLFTTQ